jgi:hypothetical protein
LAAFGVAAPAAHASLSVPTGGPPAMVRGADASTAQALSSFEAEVGGADNGTSAGEQVNGFRHITWDGLAVDGSDPGSRMIESGHVAAPSRARLEPWGIQLGPEIAVANDGFSSANPGVSFTPFSRPNVWAPYNSNTAELQVVAPAAQGTSAPVPAQTRGIGVTFLNVTTGGTTIRYYNGDILLGQVDALPGATSFAGLLFAQPVVTRVVITLGTAEIFDFDGSRVTPTLSATDFVAGDDVVLAEPAPARGAVAATAGMPVTAPLDTFTETNPNATPTATIDWGDGARTPGTITSGPSGTFIVTGNHPYAQTGSYTARVTVDDFSGPAQTRQTEIQVAPRPSNTTISCSPSSVAVSAATACTAIVSDTYGGTGAAPSGLVAFNSPTPGAVFPAAASCILGSTSASLTSVCFVQFAPGQLPPNQAHITASYGGDEAHAASTGTATVAVHRQRCSLKALSRRLRPSGFAVLATCDARTNVQIAVQAHAARNGRLKAFQLQFGTLRSAVTAGRPTVLVIKPAPGVVPALRAALHRHQHVSLKLTLTAGSGATHRTITTKRVPALRSS